MTGRSGEVFPYPYRHFTYIQPRFDRTNYDGDGYLNAYVIRTGISMPGDFNMRVELPLAETNLPGTHVFGLSDIKLRLLHATELYESLYLGYGAEFAFPTATDPALGAGKWQFRPELGAVYFFGKADEVKGSATLGVDYRFDYAGQSDRRHISVLGIVPNIDYWAPRWYIGYYATWTYDFNSRIFDLPLDVEFGYTLFPKIVVAFEFIQPLIKNTGYQNEFAIKLRYSL